MFMQNLHKYLKNPFVSAPSFLINACIAVKDIPLSFYRQPRSIVSDKGLVANMAYFPEPNDQSMMEKADASKPQ
jgi:hypothetical protein